MLYLIKFQVSKNGFIQLGGTINSVPMCHNFLDKANYPYDAMFSLLSIPLSVLGNADAKIYFE